MDFVSLNYIVKYSPNKYLQQLYKLKEKDKLINENLLKLKNHYEEINLLLIHPNLSLENYLNYHKIENDIYGVVFNKEKYQEEYKKLITPLWIKHEKVINNLFLNSNPNYLYNIGILNGVLLSLELREKMISHLNTPIIKNTHELLKKDIFFYYLSSESKDNSIKKKINMLLTASSNLSTEFGYGFYLNTE